MHPRLLGLALAPALTALVVGGCGAGDPEPVATPPPTSETSATAPGAASPEATPPARPARWRVETVASGLDHPWGLAVLPEGDVLFTERSGGISLLRQGRVRTVAEGPDDLYAEGEGGLMGLELSPGFAQDGRFFTCLATTRRDVEVIAWTLAADRRTATRAQTLVTGLTLNPSGRHSGCRLRIGADQMLYIGAGDSAQGANPQDLTVLGGKVLRVDPATGQAPPDNPFAAAPNAAQRLVWTWGHRNVQGLAVRPGTGELYAVEHGPDVDDEVNLLRAGGNYGWDPVGRGEYDEATPMTDPDIAGSIEAVWSSGDPTLATSGAAFLAAEAWGSDQGTLAIAALKAQALYLLDVETGSLRTVAALDGTHGRLRTVEPAPDGSIFVTTSNGGGEDEILHVWPE